MVPRIGDKIGPYEILGQLGRGGMGIVFSAWDERLEREVAIKLLREEFATDEMRVRFLHEARAASALLHPNICIIFDIGKQGDDPFLVMELLHGRTLRERLLDRDLSVNDLCRVLYDVSDALSLAHSRGIVHRDIKPANLFLVEKPGGRSGTKILDFGLAWMEAVAHRGAIAGAEATTAGTASYMSPEQARGDAFDGRSDLFSLGTVIYEIATGRPPFRAATTEATFEALLHQQVEPIRLTRPSFPRSIEAIVLKLLEKDPAQRFQSAAEVMDAVVDVPAADRRAAAFATPVAHATDEIQSAPADAADTAPPATAAPPNTRPIEPEPDQEFLRPVTWVDPNIRAAGSETLAAAPGESLAVPEVQESDPAPPARAMRAVSRTPVRPVVRLLVESDERSALADPEAPVRANGRTDPATPLRSHWLLLAVLALAAAFAWAIWMLHQGRPGAHGHTAAPPSSTRPSAKSPQAGSHAQF